MIFYSIFVITFTQFYRKYLSPVGSNFSLSVLAFLQSFVIAMTIISYIIGILAFYLKSKSMLVYFIVVLMISLVGLFISVIIFIVLASNSSSYLSLSNQLECSPWSIEKNPYTQYKKMNYPIDIYLTFVDQELCSSNCPCKINNINDFNNSPDLSKVTNWITSSVGAINFHQCPFDSTNTVIGNTKLNGLDLNDDDQESIFEFYRLLENKFDCVGFCSTSYFDYNNRLTFLTKYLLSDINRGEPSKFGCFKSLLDWARRFFMILGILNIGIVVGNLIILIISFNIFCNYHSINTIQVISQDHQVIPDKTINTQIAKTTEKKMILEIM